MKIYDKETLKKAVKESRNYTELCIKMGKVPATTAFKVLKRNILEYKIDVSHFDSFYKLKLKRLYPIIEKSCPICRSLFKTKDGNRDEKTYCSKKCANGLNIGNRRTPETNLKVSLALKGRIIWNVDKSGQLNFEKQLFCKEKTIIKNKVLFYEKICEFCKNSIQTRREKKMFCNRDCQMKGLWKRESYRNKILSSIDKRVKSGTHQGWTTRNILSYPERFFKKVLELNGFKGKFITNHPIKKRDLGIDCDACYFLDFYFPEFNLDLEIDGKQHKLIERADSDQKRDAALKENGYKVYRIEWKCLNKQSGKDHIKQEIKKFLEFMVHSPK